MARWFAGNPDAEPSDESAPSPSGTFRRLAYLTGGLGSIPLVAVAGLLVYHLLQDPGVEAQLSFKEREGMVRGLDFSRGGQSLIAWYLGGPVSEWETRTGRGRTGPFFRIDPVFGVGLLPDDRRVVLKTHRGVVGVHDRETGELLKQLPKVVSTNLAPLAVSPDGKRVALVEVNRVMLIDVESATLLGDYATPGRPIRCLAFTPDSATLAVGDEAGEVTLLSPADALPVARWVAHPNFVTAMGFSPDGATLYTGGQDATVRAWRPSDHASLGTFGDLPGPVTSLDVSPGGRSLALACGEKSAWMIDLDRGGRSRKLPAEHAEKVLVAKFSPDGRSLATGASDGSVRVWAVPGADAAPPSPPPDQTERDRARGSRE
jgi:WD40 repeat protein